MALGVKPFSVEICCSPVKSFPPDESANLETCMEDFLLRPLILEGCVFNSRLVQGTIELKIVTTQIVSLPLFV